MTTALRKRSELEEKYTWNLSNIFPNLDAWNAARKQVEDALPSLQAYKGQLASAPHKLLQYFKEAEEISILAMQLFQYSNLLSDSDTTNQENLALRDQGRGIFSRFAAATSFAEPELLAIPPDQLQRFREEEPELKIYAHYFDTLQRRREHIRSAEVETVLAMASDALETPRVTHGILSDAEGRYGSVETHDGTLDVTSGTMERLLGDPDIEVRRRAWEQYADGFLAHKNTFASSISGGVKRDVFYARARNHPSALEAALSNTFIPREVYDNIIETSRRKLPVWHRYWSVRRRALGLDTLHPYDVFAPLTKEEPEVKYEEACDLICQGMSPLGDDYCEPMRRGLLQERWVDVYPNVGKRSGAYSSGSYRTNPFILMSYNDKLTSLSTLAHEIGHSMHSYLTRHTQPFVYSRYGIFLAEVASNFNQALVRNYLLENNSDPHYQTAVIEEAMYNFHRYFFIMPILARFELSIHTQVEQGQALTADKMIKELADLFREGYGPEVEIDEERVGITWAQFPSHMYMNFYVYQYATGIAAANALADKVIKEGPEAAQKYKTFLSSGGSQYPLDTLKQAGIDMTSPEPVERAFSVLEGFVDRLEKLTT